MHSCYQCTRVSLLRCGQMINAVKLFDDMPIRNILEGRFWGIV